MPQMTVEQFGESIKQKYPQYASMDNKSLGEQTLQKYPQYQRLIVASTQEETPEPKGEGFIASLAKPFTKLAASGMGLVQGIGNLGGAALAGLTGNKEAADRLVGQANEALTKERNFGPLGKARPFTINQETGQALTPGRGVADILGGGAELASFMLPGGAIATKGASTAAKLAKPGLLRSALTGAKYAGALGGLQQGGSALQKEDATVGSVLGSTAVGTLGGAALGAGGVVAGRAIGKGVDVAKKGAQMVGKYAPMLKTTTGNVPGQVGRTLGNVGANIEEKAAAIAEKRALPVTHQVAIERGIPQEITSFIDTAAPETKKSFARMVDIAEGQAKNLRSRNQPKEIAGEAILERADHIIKSRSAVGKQLGDFVKTLPKKLVDVTDEYTSLLDDLASKGIQVRPNGTLRSTGGAAPSDLKFYQRIVQRLRPNTQGQVLRTPENIHQTRQLLRNIFSEGERQQKALSSEVKGFVDMYRSKLADRLPEQYRTLSQDYAVQTEALEDFIKLLGYKGDIDDLTAKQLKVGEVALRMLGNAADRPTSVIQSLDDVAKQYGYKGTTDIRDLVDFSDFLESIVGPPARSLQGHVLRAGEKAVGELQQGPVGMLTNALARNLSPTQKQQIEALRGLFNQSGEPLVSAFKRFPGLSVEDRALEEAALDMVRNNESALIAANRAKHGNIVNTDDFRPLFKDIGYRGTNSAAVQEPSSYLANKAFEQELRNPEPFAAFTSGMSGSGKTSALKNISNYSDVTDQAAVILDSNLSSISSAKKKIQLAIDAGKEPRIFYVYRDPVEGFVNGVIKRMKTNQEEMGRIVPTKVIADNAIGSWDVAKKLFDDGVSVTFVDNSLGNGNAAEKTLSEMSKKIKYPSLQELTGILNAEAKRLFDAGELTPDQYQKLVE